MLYEVITTASLAPTLETIRQHGHCAVVVLVQIHDVFTPRDYPAKWVLDDRRLWNEQYVMEAFLAFNREFEVRITSYNVCYTKLLRQLPHGLSAPA